VSSLYHIATDLKSFASICRLIFCRRDSTKKALLCGFAASVLAGAYAWCSWHDSFSRPALSAVPRSRAEQQPESLRQLLASPASQISRLDIALVNMLCAEGLPGADSLSPRQCIGTLEEWTKRVRSETQRHLYRFKANPREFDSCEGYFRMLMMAVVLHEDFSVRYNPARITTPANVDADDHFFADSRDLFLHGLLRSSLNSRPSTLNHPTGTCSSLPVLYTALGRRLGYPLKLVTTKSHLFLRWDSPAERFNLEATGRGMNRYDDDHFKQWPFPVTEEEIQADGYLRSLTPVEELALFLSLRGHCLKEAGRLPEAIASYAEAARLAPDSRPYRLLLADARQQAVQPNRKAAASPASAGRVPPPAYAQTAPLLPPPPSALAAQPGAPRDPNPLLKLRTQ
jgi:hypothetical protein